MNFTAGRSARGRRQHERPDREHRRHERHRARVARRARDPDRRGRQAEARSKGKRREGGARSRCVAEDPEARRRCVARRRAAARGPGRLHAGDRRQHRPQGQGGREVEARANRDLRPCDRSSDVPRGHGLVRAPRGEQQGALRSPDAAPQGADRGHGELCRPHHGADREDQDPQGRQAARDGVDALSGLCVRRDAPRARWPHSAGHLLPHQGDRRRRRLRRHRRPSYPDGRARGREDALRLAQARG